MSSSSACLAEMGLKGGAGGGAKKAIEVVGGKEMGLGDSNSAR